MSAIPRNAPQSRRRQRGSVVVNAAIVISVIVIALIGTELGYLFYLKRDLQKAVDMAALAGAQQIDPTSCAAAITLAKSNANGTGTSDPTRNLPAAFSLQDDDVVCGHWNPATASDTTERHFDPGLQPFNAIRVAVRRTPALLLPGIPGNVPRSLFAEAVATQKTPQAALSIRSTLVNVSDDDANLLNLVTGSLLGGNLDISAIGWNGLLDANINLLDYLVALGASAGDYQSVLNSRISLVRLLDVAADLLERNGNLANAAIALEQLSVAAQVRDLDIRVGDLLGVATGTPSSALNVDLQVFGLAQGAIQLANGENALASDLNISLPGLLNLSSKIKVIEGPQYSAIGNPQLVNPALGIADPEKIYVRTAQIRTLHSIDLSNVTGLVNGLTSALTAALSPLVNFLESVVSLNLGKIVAGLFDLLNSVACGGPIPCSEAKVIYTQVLPDARIDVSIEGSAGSAYVTDHECVAESKSLSVQGATSVANVRIGRISNAFSSIDPISVSPIPLVEIGNTMQRHASCFLLVCSGQLYKNLAGNFVAYPSGLPPGAIPGDAMRTVIAGFGLQADVPVAGSQTATPLVYAAPAPENLPEIDDPPYDGTGRDPSYKAIHATDIVSSLGDTLNGLEISTHKSDGGGILGGLLSGTVSLIGGLLSNLSGIIKTALSPLLDPLLNGLLRFVGIDLATTEIGARLTCGRGAELVY